MHPADRKSLTEALEAVTTGKERMLNGNCRWINIKGDVVWVNYRGKVLCDNLGKPSLMIGRVSEEALRHLFNPLTGLWNKPKMREDLKVLLEKQVGYLMLFDIDGLAAINLRHGRAYGDTLLKAVAELLDTHDLITAAYHIDHNNFAAVINADTTEDVEAVFVSLQREMYDKCTFTACAVPINRDFFHDVSSLLDSINLTLKKAKQNKRGHLAFFSVDEIGQRIRSLALLEEFQASVQNGCEGFEVFYQPQVKTGNYDLYAVEALLRYQSPVRGRVFPDEFIPILESSRLIDTVGLWVLEQSLLQCKAWRDHIPDLHVSVNFSIVQFEDIFITEKIMGILNATGMPGEALTIEITESLQLQESPQFSACVKSLKALGVSFSIDDFGTGYSNLGYLKQMNVDEIKIDRIFVSGIEKNTYNHRLIENILEFAKMSAIRVCCEGIESIRELAILEGLNPDLLQGYLFAKPASAADIERTFIDCGTAEYEQHMEFIHKIYHVKEKMGVIHFDPKDILRETDVGLWIIRINEADRYFEMHADETMERIMAVERKVTPQECFVHWQSRICESHVDYVHKNLMHMMNVNKVVQLEYPWMHPILGRVMVRSNGKRVKDSDGMIVLEGYQKIVSNMEVV
ncbi:MAG: EAL domain-containing protein [Clostridia bacterium]|nr:EAL domain-containing protein [Clostridia bacterium]